MVHFAELCARHEAQLTELWPTLATQPWYKSAKAAVKLGEGGAPAPLAPQVEGGSALNPDGGPA